MPRLVGIFALGGLQGAIGWYMVRRVVDRIDVSQYRLALHLSLAVLIFAGFLGGAVARPAPGRYWGRAQRSRRRAGLPSVDCVFSAMVAGAFVAGLKAGADCNTWPLMEADSS